MTAVDLGYQQGDAISNFVTKIDEAAHAKAYIQLFDQIGNDPDKVTDVTERLSEHIAAVYQENSWSLCADSCSRGEMKCRLEG